MIQTLNGDTFLLAWDNYPVLAQKGIESITLQSVEASDWGGFQQSSYDTVQFVCFASVTLIETDQGPVPVEDLTLGDLVQTADHGSQPVRWLGARSLRFPPAPKRQKPVLIRQGCFGPRLPSAPLILSPQHRIVTRQDDQRFVSAISLIAQPGVRRMQGCRSERYHSVLLPQHEVNFANALPVESLHPRALRSPLLSPGQRLSALTRLPGLQLPGSAQAHQFARPLETLRTDK